MADLIKLRYRLIPYLYELLWQSHSAYEPVLRPLFAEFPHDPGCLVDGDDMMLGSSMLVAPVVDPGQSTRAVYLPAGSRWVSYWSGETFDGGQTVTLPAPFERPVFLLREGSVIPLNIAEQHFGRPADERAFLAVPYADAGTAQGGSIEDDGETEAWRNGEQGRWNVTLTGDANTLRVTLERSQWMPRVQPQVRVFVPMRETRAVVCANGTLVTDHTADGWRCLTISVPH
ncbi:alpha-glucosidase (family GH31 glycosyl hydrolase) [Paraburkholderia sp. WSM4174]